MIITSQIDAGAKYLTIAQLEGIAGYVWMVDGMLRTVTSSDQPPTDIHGNLLALDIKYRIENMNGVSESVNCVGEYQEGGTYLLKCTRNV